MHLTKYLHQQGSRVLLDEAILSTYTLRYFLSHREERQVVKPMKIHKIVKKNKFKTFPRLRGLFQAVHVVNTRRMNDAERFSRGGRRASSAIQPAQTSYT